MKIVIGCEHLWKNPSARSPLLPLAGYLELILRGKVGSCLILIRHPWSATADLCPMGVTCIHQHCICVIMYLCNYVFCIQTQCVCVLRNGCDQHPTTMYFALPDNKQAEWLTPEVFLHLKTFPKTGFNVAQEKDPLLKVCLVEMYFQLWCKTLPLHLRSDTSWCIWGLLEDKCSLFRVLGIINTDTGTNTKWMHMRTLWYTIGCPSLHLFLNWATPF